MAGILPWFLTDLLAIIATRVVLGIMEATIMTVATAMMADYFEGERRGRGMGMWTGSFFLAQFIAPLAFGEVAAQVGGIGTALHVIATASGLASVAALDLLAAVVLWGLLRDPGRGSPRAA